MRAPSSQEPSTEPLVSVIIPAFNSARFLSETLESVRLQSESRLECVIVDDGSTDTTAEIAHEFVSLDRRFRFERQQNRGASAARNRGFRATNPATKYVTFMDSDDVWLAHALGNLLARLESAPRAVGSHGLAEMIDAHGIVMKEVGYSDRGRSRLGLRRGRLVPLGSHEPTDFDVLINGNVLFPPGLVLARREAYQAVGPFDEQFNGPEDWDMLIRLSRLGHFEFIDGVILLYRRHSGNLGASDAVARQAWLVRCKAFHSTENSPDQKRRARRGWRAYQLLRMAEAKDDLTGAFSSRDSRTFVRKVMLIIVLAFRYARGWPAPRVRSAPVRW